MLRPLNVRELGEHGIQPGERELAVLSLLVGCPPERYWCMREAGRFGVKHLDEGGAAD